MDINNKENDVFKDMNDWLTGRQSRKTRYLLNLWCCVVEGIRVGVGRQNNATNSKKVMVDRSTSRQIFYRYPIC